MKKTIIIVLLFIFALQVPLWPLQAANELVLKSPSGGDVWRSGETNFIKWQTSLSAKDYPIISVYLVRDSDPGATWALAEVSAFDAYYYYKWTVPFNIQSGKDYRIIVSTGRGSSCTLATNGQAICHPIINNTDFSDRSNKPFTIIQLASPEERKPLLPDNKNPNLPPIKSSSDGGGDGGKKVSLIPPSDTDIAKRLTNLERIIDQLLEEIKFLKKLFSFGLIK